MDMDTAEVVARLSEESYKEWTQGFFKDLASYDSLIGMLLAASTYSSCFKSIELETYLISNQYFAK